MGKLIHRQVYANQHIIDVSLVNGIGRISITDNGLYPDNDSRTERRGLGYNTMAAPLLTRENLIELKQAINDCLKLSK